MKPWEIYDLIKKTKYTKAGDDIDYSIQTINGRVFLLFQESTTRRDWENNFNFPRKLYRKQKNWLRVHRGYGDAWKTINDKVMDELLTALIMTGAGFYPVIAGWSFGGAMAQLAAEDFHYRTGFCADVVTFGAPKVAGDIWTAKNIHKAGWFYQYANVNDCVPLMPPLPGFHHIKKLKIGGPFYPLQLFKPEMHHTTYSNEELYRETIHDISF